ncbi:hypothetical protein E1B28_000761 [Marasmius oreades]|uniref:Pentacotripeptide-repeat region of PRORP domain-containing protein n=1 Tax=Marasmius oreades TaxID=181124 RepID=A0A9P7V200_9AGAR|nr:uncharacterized protein E1B28_000761 [Marasmius oreades]KAG7098858.1 hypothetical protein E1B28_000761 [Marasmius oreades]
MLSSSFRRVPRRPAPRCRRAGRCITTSNTEGATEVPPPLRIKPWRNKPDTSFQRSTNGTSLSRYNLRLSMAATKSYVSSCFETLSEMKENNVKPDLSTYHPILQVLANIRAETEALAVYDDMLSNGIQLDIHAYNLLLDAIQHRSSGETWSILHDMRKQSINPNSGTYSKIIRIFTAAQNLETSLVHLQEMRRKGVEPEFETVQDVVDLAAKQGHPRLALDLIDSLKHVLVRDIGLNVWKNCLKASANILWKDGTLKSWEAVVKDEAFEPDESLCVSVLHVAGHHGLPDLSASVLAVLKKSEIPWNEPHFASLIEAFTCNGQISEAFTTLNLMQSNNISISPTTLSPLVEAIKKDEDSLDAAWSIVENLPKAHIAALNTVIRAAGALGDLQRAVGAYKSATDMNVEPNLDTFHSLLEAALTARRPLGDIIMEDMKAASIDPDQRIFELLIDLSLTQESYEDAFYHLEEMKAAGFTPQQSTYESIVRKCALNGDERYTIALDEMKEKGHVPSGPFQREVLSAYKNVSLQQPDAPSTSFSSHGRGVLDGSAQRFIEAGGLV